MNVLYTISGKPKMGFFLSKKEKNTIGFLYSIFLSTYFCLEKNYFFFSSTPQSRFGGVHTDFTCRLIFLFFSSAHQHETCWVYRTGTVIKYLFFEVGEITNSDAAENEYSLLLLAYWD